MKLIAITALAILFAACSETKSIDESMDLVKSVEFAAQQGNPADTCTYDGELTEADINGLIFMREEEKLAHDVYLHFFETYGEIVFQNIANSEAKHMEAVKKLLEGYGIEDPALEGVGNFNNTELATLYEKLIAEGKDGLGQALTVGATIEDLDISDLTALLRETENTDLMRVYENLVAGSKNHIRIFINLLASTGGSYTATYISAEDLGVILSAENEKGKRQGSRKGNGKGNQGNYSAGNGGEDCDGTQSGAMNGNQSGAGNGQQNGKQSGNSGGNGGSNGKG